MKIKKLFLALGISLVISGFWTGCTSNTSSPNEIVQDKQENETAVEFDGIKILVEKSLGFDLIHFWNCSDASTYPNTAWPGVPLSEEGDDYCYYFNNVSSVSLLITNSSASKLFPSDAILTGKGIYRFTSDGGKKVVQSKPVITVFPATENIYENGIISISVESENAELLSVSGKINDRTIALTSDSNSFNVNEYCFSGETVSVYVEAKNRNGISTSSVSYNVISAPSYNGPTRWEDLRIYQIMVSSFQDGDETIGYSKAYGPSGQLTGGDLQGVINSLDYIQNLGMNAIWMTPIFQSKGESELDSTGYFAYDYFNIDSHFGTNEKFAELVANAHARGIAVILDGVFGHHGSSGIKASPESEGSIEVTGKNNPIDWTVETNREYFYRVAQYWIKNYKIDGWRFDQCYQVGLGDKGTNCNTGGHNWWYEVRLKIKNAALINGEKGTDWGTLGYTVGEHWDGNNANVMNGSVAKGTADGYGLQSCFDFASRYAMVNAFAKAESDAGGNSLGDALSYTYKTASEKGFTHDEGYYPNVFMTNHDLVRFGNLLNWKYSITPTSDPQKYYGLHKAAIGAVAAYSGPITVYYGDEWGAYVEGYTGPGALGAYNDNAARSTGKISGFTTREQDTVDWTSKVMNARSNYPALSCGNNICLESSIDYYVGKKELSGEKSVGFIINKGGSEVSYSFSGKDLVSGSRFTGNCPAYSAVFIELD